MTSCTKEQPDNSTDESLNESSDFENSNNKPEVEIDVDLVKGSPYFYGYGISIEGDNRLDTINGIKNGKVTLKTNASPEGSDTFKLKFSDWYKNEHIMDVPNNTAVISVDFGFISAVKSFAVSMNYNGTFKGIDVYGSTDGYNYTAFLGTADKYENDVCSFNFSDPINLKSIEFVIYLNDNESIDITNISVIGDRTYSRTSLSEGATYKWFGTLITNYHNKAMELLTDGKLYDGTNDSLAGKKSNIILIDLNEEKNINEVYFDLMIPSGSSNSLPTKYTVDVSLDNKEYINLGESFLTTTTNENDKPVNRYFVTRNNTVKGRYVRITGDASTDFITDEIFINGNEYEVEEPDYDFFDYKKLSYTNVAENASVLINDASADQITDSIFSKTTSIMKGKNKIEINLNKSYDYLCGITLILTGEINDINIEAGGIKQNITFYSQRVSDKFYYNVFFEKCPGKTVIIEFETNNDNKCSEVLIYNEQPQLPFVNGGFFQLPTNGGGNTASLSSEYGWYLQLKGMRELGMDYVVIQYSAHYLAKSTLINGERIKAAGYTYTDTYGTDDLPLAVLNAAEKLGMLVYLGTIHDSDFNAVTDAKFEDYKKIVADGKLLIEDINDMYGEHPAFAGYYLSDETCDYWLNQNRGVEACRYVYKEQSDLIRSIASDKLIMIAPAIWRSGTPAAGGNALYEMIKPENAGGKPIVDIVAAQDCLGREGTLEVSNNAYNSFISYLEQWALNVRKAGAEFWHDAEVFEITSTSKRYTDIIKSLTIEAPVSGNIIVFDIPHYFSIYSMGAFNNQYIYYKNLIMRDYAKYYSQMKGCFER